MSGRRAARGLARCAAALGFSLSSCQRAPPPAPLGAPRVVEAAPTGRSREQALRAQLAWERGELEVAAHELERARFEDPGSDALVLAWAEAALRAGDLDQLRRARLRLDQNGRPPAFAAAGDAMIDVMKGVPGEAAALAMLEATPADAPGAAEAAGLLWRGLGAAAGAAGPALAARAGVPLDCVDQARMSAAAGDGAAGRAQLRACAGALPAERLPDALFVLASQPEGEGALPLALLFADRMWAEHLGPPPAAAALSLEVAAAAGDRSRLDCWRALSQRLASPDALGAPRYTPAARWARTSVGLGVAQAAASVADPTLDRWLDQRAARWARCRS